MKLVRTLMLGALLAALSPLASRSAHACAGAFREGGTATIADESALIVYDSKTQLEHFIRTADFQTGETTFGFLVPVPTEPELAEADERVFSVLEAIYEKRREEVRDYSLHFVWALERAMWKPTESPVTVRLGVGVDVLSQQRLGALDAAVLAAESPEALSTWLSENGFAMRAPMVEWVAPYVRQGFKIVAFKYAKDAEAPRLGARAIRLSFKAPVAFFPYREPSDARRSGSQRFRAYVLADGRVDATLGATRPWAATLRASLSVGSVPFSFPLSQPANGWLTLFEEQVARRPEGEDLFFRRSAEQKEVLPEPLVIDEPIYLPIEGVPVAFLLLGVMVALAVRKARQP